MTLQAMQLSPYVDVWHTKTKLDSYTETGGSYPAHFDSREDDVTELRLGVNGAIPVADTGLDFVVNVEAARRFDDEGDSATGQVIGMFSFDLDEENYDQNWLKGGVGIEGKVGTGKVSLMLNGTTEGEFASSWVAASYQLAF